MRGVAVHVREESGVVVAAQRGFDFARQACGLRHAPLRQQPGVHQHVVVLRMQQALVAQPVQQFVAVRRVENLVQRIGAVQLRHAFRDGEQMQVVVAEHGDRAVAQRLDQPQHLQRTRSAVHQVADQPQPVCRRIETGILQQPRQFGITTLHIAHRINRHHVFPPYIQSGILQVRRMPQT